MTFVYHCQEGGLRSAAVNGREAEAVRLANPYRLGGLRIAREEVQRYAGSDRIVIDIYM
ncbi:hypothetical protein D3C80_2233480 [compost metagenome]